MGRQALTSRTLSLVHSTVIGKSRWHPPMQVVENRIDPV
ncbi:MAG: hypothetical protein OFPI_17970 [Osedax symbiont Rs2]|nr:MAG: hypothetical protein OFPI_17970 [Osedax symbiont Rs2]